MARETWPAMFMITSSCHNHYGTMKTDFDRQKLAREAKAIVALAFRNGPIEQIHAGRECPTCTGRPGYSRITDAEMRIIMKNAVDRVFALLLLRDQDPEKYESQMRFGERYTAKWDDPETPFVT